MGEAIKEFFIGETRIRINDRYCKDVSPEEAKRILENIVALLIGYMRQRCS